MPARHRAQAKPKLIPLRTMAEVIDKLDGDAGVKKLTGKRQNNIANWRGQQKKFPAKLYEIMRHALAKKGYRAPPALWGIDDPPRT